MTRDEAASVRPGTAVIYSGKRWIVADVTTAGMEPPYYRLRVPVGSAEAYGDEEVKDAGGRTSYRLVQLAAEPARPEE